MSSSSLVDPSLGTTTTPPSSNSSSEVKGPSIRCKPIELVVGRAGMADSDLVDRWPGLPEFRSQLMVGSGTRTICSVSNVRASIKCSRDVCCKVPLSADQVENERVEETHLSENKYFLAISTFRRELDASNTPSRCP